jgi:LemA protein
VRNKSFLVALIIVALVFLVGLSGYNTLVAQEEKVNSNWSEIDNQLQRRSNLIPNLVETVKGYARHEKEIFENVSQARAKLAGAQTVNDRAAANTQLSGALSRLLAIAENYPALKADANFRQLSDELAGTENRITVARRDYNQAVQEYNSIKRRFPTVIFARAMGFDNKDYFIKDEGAGAVPQVDF